jgi:hypothetical protein
MIQRDGNKSILGTTTSLTYDDDMGWEGVRMSYATIQ